MLTNKLVANPTRINFYKREQVQKSFYLNIKSKFAGGS